MAGLKFMERLLTVTGHLKKIEVAGILLNFNVRNARSSKFLAVVYHFV